MSKRKAYFTQVLEPQSLEALLSARYEIAALGLPRVTQLWLRLRPIDQQVLIRRYGLDGLGVRSLKAVGKECGISHEGARQLQINALDRLIELGQPQAPAIGPLAEELEKYDLREALGGGTMAHMIANSLRRAGYYTLESLAGQSRQQLLMKRWIGPVTITRIDTALRINNLEPLTE